MQTATNPFKLSARLERSYDVFQHIVNELCPKFVITCQCRTFDARNLFVRKLCSTSPPPADLAYLRIREKIVPVFRAFHPGVYKAGHIGTWVRSDSIQQIKCRQMLKDLLGLIFHKAFRTLSNISVKGSRERVLRDQISRLLSDVGSAKISRGQD